jgi:hypothetical protein
VLPEGSTIELASDHGVLYTRGERFTENRFYSDPTAAGWQRLAERHRREFLKRTDRGVFSVQVEDYHEANARARRDETASPGSVDLLAQLRRMEGGASRPSERARSTASRRPCTPSLA